MFSRIHVFRVQVFHSPCFSGPMFFRVQVFQGPGFSGSRLFRIQVIQGPGFSGSSFFRVQFFQGVRVQVLEVAKSFVIVRDKKFHVELRAFLITYLFDLFLTCLLDLVRKMFSSVSLCYNNYKRER